jgi:hypothetical protein
MNYDGTMKPIFIFAVLTALAAPAAAQSIVCPASQTCRNGAPPVPFPVINPFQGLSNVLNIRRDSPPAPVVGGAPIATQVLPAGAP